MKYYYNFVKLPLSHKTNQYTSIEYKQHDGLTTLEDTLVDFIVSLTSQQSISLWAKFCQDNSTVLQILLS